MSADDKREKLVGFVASIKKEILINNPFYTCFVLLLCSIFNPNKEKENYHFRQPFIRFFRLYIKKEKRVKELTLSEIIFLLAIWRLEENAYGVTIRKQIAKVTGKTYTYGTLYSALDQLFKKGYVIKSAGPPTPERGGRSKIFYKLTQEGIKALKASRELQKTIWRGIPELTFDKV